MIPTKTTKLLFAVYTLLLSILIITTNASDDYVIIGCGTAGSVLANRLSLDNKVTVLELGQDLTNTIWTGSDLYGEFTPFVGKQRFASYPWTEGASSYNYIHPQIAGGGSAINGGVFQRPTIDDLASWNSSLWTFNATINDWKTIESYLGGGNPAVHGYSGPVTVQTFPLDSIMSLVNASMVNTLGLPYNNDSNSGNGYGVSNYARNIALSNTGQPVRQDMYSRFVLPIKTRKNLNVILNAVVTSIDFKSNGKHTVNYIVNGEQDSIKAKKEVIIALDALGATKLLMLSGYGNCSTLAGFGISCFYNNPYVGAGFVDSLLTTLTYVGPAPATPVYGAILTAQYKSPGYTGIGNNIELATASAPVAPGLYGYLWTILQHGVSHGSISLRDANPFSNPVISLDFYETNASAVYDYVDAFKKVRAVMDAVGVFVEQSPGRVYAPGVGAVPTTSTDQEIATYLSKSGGVDYHGLGGCAIGKVVDDRLRVIGIPKLRVVSSAVVPKTLTSHSTCATATLLGAVASRLILEDNN